MFLGNGLYSATATKLCTACDGNCQTCTATKCLSCTSTTYMSIDHVTCALTCSSGYISLNSTYKHCVSNCVTDDASYLNSAGTSCILLADCTVLNYE